MTLLLALGMLWIGLFIGILIAAFGNAAGRGEE